MVFDTSLKALIDSKSIYKSLNYFLIRLNRHLEAKTQ